MFKSIIREENELRSDITESEESRFDSVFGQVADDHDKVLYVCSRCRGDAMFREMRLPRIPRDEKIPWRKLDVSLAKVMYCPECDEGTCFTHGPPVWMDKK